VTLLKNDSSADSVIIHKTVWILFAVAINALEFFIPRIPFFPWLKPGLANCVTIVWIIEFGLIDAVLFSLLRIWIAGFYFGFSFYTLSLSLSGGICSTLVMGLVWTAFGKKGWLGTVGVGIIGALVHNLTQIVVMYFLLAANAHLFYQVPLMLVAAIGFGTLTGAIAPALLNIVRNWTMAPSVQSIPFSAAGRAALGRDRVFAALLFAAGCTVAFVNNTTVLGTGAIAGTALVQLVHRGSLRMLIAPVTRFWPMFLFVACVHAFLSYGTNIERFPLLTHEGVNLAFLQWLKLWTWIELSFLLTRFNFHGILFRLLQRAFPGNRATLLAGVLALEYFPAIVAAVQKKARSAFFRSIFHPLRGMHAGFAYVYREIERRLGAGQL
jgi:heptaprenyl diphosphate synthase